MSKGKRVEGGFAGLGEAVKKEAVGPALPNLSGFRGIGDLAVEVEAAQKRTAEVQAYLEAVPKACEDALSVILGVPGSSVATQTQTMLKERILDVQDPYARPRALWYYAAAYVRAAIQHTLSFREVVTYLTEELGLLKKIEKPEERKGEKAEAEEERKKRQRIGEIRYTYPDGRMLVPTDYPHDMKGVVQETFTSLVELAAATRAINAERAEIQLEAFLQGASRSWAGLLAESRGEFGNYTYVVNVPRGKRTVKDHDTGEVKTLPAAGGLIKVRLEVAEGKPTRVIALATNSGNPGFHTWLADVVTSRTAILLDSIKESRFNLLPHIYRQTPEETRKIMSRLHTAMHRAFLGHQEAMAKKAEADKIAAKANVDWQAFLLDHTAGTAYVSCRLFTAEVREPVLQDGKPVVKDGKPVTSRATKDFHHAGVLVERQVVPVTDPDTGEERSEAQIRVLEVNETGKELFPKACYEWHAGGENYVGLAAPFGQFLRRVSGIARSVRRKEVKAAEQDATRKWKEGDGEEGEEETTPQA